MKAFDYDKQQWVTGEAARLVRISQLEADLDCLTGWNREKFATFVGITNITAAVADKRAELAGLKGGAQ